MSADMRRNTSAAPAAPFAQDQALEAGLVLPARKAQSTGQPIRALPLPERVHILLPDAADDLELLVGPGERVLGGQPLARVNDAWGFSCHSSISGTVLGIERRFLPLAARDGVGLAQGLCLSIAADGRDERFVSRSLADWRGLDSAALLRRLASAGIRGLGGAGFPAHRKLAAAAIHTLIINACECEPYISADDALLREQADEVAAGISVLLRLLAPERCLVAIEDDKPEARRALAAALDALGEPRIQLRVLPARYPTGAETVLIRLLTGLELAPGRRPVEEGLLCHNVGSVQAIWRAAAHGEALIERVTTLTGEALTAPGNYRIRLGTPLADVLAHAGLEPARLQRLLAGGPLMGVDLPLPGTGAVKPSARLSVPVDSTQVREAMTAPVLAAIPLLAHSNCLIAAAPGELDRREASAPCIRCGQCATICPARLQPELLWLQGRAGAHDKAARLDLAACIECGACAEVCPSALPLVAQYRASKAVLREAAEERRRAEQARQRYERRQARLARQQARDAARRRALEDEARESAPVKSALSPAIAAALARVKAKRGGGDGESA